MSGPRIAHPTGGRASRTARRLTPIARCNCSSGTNHFRVARAVVSTIRRGCGPIARGLRRGVSQGACGVAERTGMVNRGRHESGSNTRAPGGTRAAPRVHRRLSPGWTPSTTRRAQGMPAARARCRLRRSRRQSRTSSMTPLGSSSSSARKLNTPGVCGRRWPPHWNLDSDVAQKPPSRRPGRLSLSGPSERLSTRRAGPIPAVAP
jgi:hypothetical protein